MEMQTGGGFVEDKDSRLSLFHAQEISQLHTLVLTTGQRRRRLSQFNISQSHVLQRSEFLHNLFLSVFSKEFYGLIHGHFQYIIYILILEFHFQRIAFEAFAVARLTFQHQVGHKLHFHRNRSVAFTFFATSSFGVERKVSGCVTHLFGQGLLCVKFTDFIVCFYISHRIAA